MWDVDTGLRERIYVDTVVVLVDLLNRFSFDVVNVRRTLEQVPFA